jgi:hypothetical protein
MATKRTMVFYGNTKKANNGDTNEPGKKPKPTTLKIEDSASSKSAAKYKPTQSASLDALKFIKANTGKINPVTGKIMTEADATKLFRYNEKKKRS